ncbi:hypothetical protein [Calidifontibacillus oryziterrae]|uniref:hypothetical protein n=1 Tax=Calidifontibacillus oryziterrae TaxID=1191699 RepID=UPI0003014573|nr:hypothetical protein [Calidifontibacillus oryziterrae]
MNEQKVSELNQGQLLEILQSAYQKGEKSIINNPKEMVQEMISQMKSIRAK